MALTEKKRNHSMKLLAMLVWNHVVKILFLGIFVDCCCHDEVKYISKNTIEDIKRCWFPGLGTVPAMRLNRKKDGCPSHNTPDVWNSSGYNTEIWKPGWCIIFPNFCVPILKM